MAKRGATRRRKMRGGAPQRVGMTMEWTVGTENRSDILSYLQNQGLPKETTEDFPSNEVHSFADLVDDLESYVEDLGYSFVDVPLKGTKAGEPIGLRYIEATWAKPGDPPTPDPYKKTIKISGKDVDVTVTFVPRKGQPMPSLAGGKTKKTRGRRRA